MRRGISHDIGTSRVKKTTVSIHTLVTHVDMDRHCTYGPFLNDCDLGEAKS